MLHKPLIWTLLCFLLPFGAFSQTFDYGNSWVNPAHNYTIIKVWEDGIYRVSGQELQTAGMNLTGVNPANLHLIYRGEEEYIHVETQGGQVEFIEFFGRRNDGRVDSIMYRDPNSQPVAGIHAPDLAPNKRISLFSDTSAYYLFADNLPGRRWSLVQDTQFQNYTPEAAFLYENYREYHPNQGAVYVPGGGDTCDIEDKYNPEWITGEGYVGPGFADQNPFSFPLNAPFAWSGATGFQLNVRVLSPEVLGIYQHELSVEWNGVEVINDTFAGPKIKTYSAQLPGSPGTLNQTTLKALGISILGAPILIPDSGRICWASLIYEREFELNQEATIKMLWDKPTPAYFRFQHADIQQEGWVYDLFEHKRIAAVADGDTLKAIVPGSPLQRFLYVCTDQGIRQPQIVANQTLGSLSAANNGAAMILITHPDLLFSAQAFASYKDTNSFNPVSCQVVTTDQIYQEFGYGSPTPWAIKRFCKYAQDEWNTPPTYFLFWGKGSHSLREHGDNFVPTYGYPFTDWPYVFNYDNQSLDSFPRVGVGRLHVTSNDQGLIYLQKVREFESTPPAAWMRNGLFESVARSSVELNVFRSAQTLRENTFESSPFFGRAHSFFTGGSVVDSNSVLAHEEVVSRGCGYIELLGYNPDSVTLYRLQDPGQYTHQGKYPLVNLIGVVNENYSPQPSFADKWLFEGGKGAIGFMSFPSVFYFSPANVLENGFANYAFDSSLNLSVTQMMLRSMQEFRQGMSGFLAVNRLQQWNYMGDPSIQLKTGLADVWPGDANDDRLADVFDLLPIGLAHGASGPLRPNASYAWQGQPGPWWNQSLPSYDSLDYRYIDTDGDGNIQDADTLAIHLNYGLSHNKTLEQSQSEGDVPLFITYSSDTVTIGDTLQIHVLLGTPQEIADSVYGVALSLYYDPQYLDAGSVQIDLSPAWLGQTNQNLLGMAQHFPSLGRIDLGFTRTDHLDTTGQGKLATIGVVVIDNVSGKLVLPAENLQLMVGKSQGVRASGELLEVGVSEGTFVLDRSLGNTQGFQVYPNPAQGWTQLDLGPEPVQHLRMVDAMGRIIRYWEDPDRFLELDLSGLTQGIYTLQAESVSGTRTAKLVLMN